MQQVVQRAVPPSRLLEDVIPNRAESPVRNLLFLVPVWVGHSCPTPLTLILILTLILTLTGKGTALSRAANRRRNRTRLQPLRPTAASQRDVIPHRAESPVRNLLFSADDFNARAQQRHPPAENREGRGSLTLG